MKYKLSKVVKSIKSWVMGSLKSEKMEICQHFEVDIVLPACNFIKNEALF